MLMKIKTTKAVLSPKQKFPIGAKTVSRHITFPAPPHCILNTLNGKWYLCPTYTCIIQGLLRKPQATLRLRGLGSNTAEGAYTVAGRAGRERSWGSRCEGTGGRRRSQPEAGAPENLSGILGDSDPLGIRLSPPLENNRVAFAATFQISPEFLSCELQPPCGGILGNVVRGCSALRKRGGRKAEGIPAGLAKSETHSPA